MTWERTVSQAYGRIVAIHARHLAAVTDVLPWWWQAQDDLEPEHHVAIDPAWDDPLTMVRDLEFWVAEHATAAVFVHAGVVAVGGRALLLPGRSFVGKSSLTAALLRAGATYGSDEYAVITPDGLVHPYPRRLVIRRDGGLDRVPAAELGADTMTGPARLHTVADLHFSDGAPWAVEPFERSRVMLSLLDNSVAATSRPIAVLDALVAATASLETAIGGVRGDADVAAGELLRLLG